MICKVKVSQNLLNGIPEKSQLQQKKCNINIYNFLKIYKTTAKKL